jgi:hypothetical protein
MWLERAIERLFDLQTEREQQRPGTTIVDNEVGLQQADAKLFTEYALKIKRERKNGKHYGECLNEMQKRIARRPWRRPRRPIPTICKYRVQVWQMLNEAARIKKQNSIS